MSIIENISCQNEIELIIDKNISPHYYHLTPSKIKNLKDADIIILVSKQLETPLYKVLQNHSLLNKKLLILENIPGLNLVKNNAISEINESNHDHDHDHHHDSDIDPHIWLDPKNVKVISEYLSEIINKMNPQSSCRHESLKRFKDELDEIENYTAKELKGARNKSIIVTHNAYNYLTTKYGIKVSGVLFTNSHYPLSVKQMQNIKNNIRENNVRCILVEPQFKSQSVDKLIEQLEINKISVDIEWGPKGNIKNIYRELIVDTAKSISECLGVEQDLPIAQ